jgi:hypothetical protein
MRRFKSITGQTCPDAFQHALDALDVIGSWEWDAATDLVRADAFVALLFNVDPEIAESGVPFATYNAAIHGEDRERAVSLMRRSAGESSAYLTEYRVNSIDGRTRWVLARGRFTSDADGKLMGGSGILVDITRMRMSEATFDEVEPVPAVTPLERATDHAIATQYAIMELADPELKARVEALLMGLGRRLVRQEIEQRRHLN